VLARITPCGQVGECALGTSAGVWCPVPAPPSASPAVSAAAEPASIPWITRVWFAVTCGLRVLLDGGFAARAWAVKERSLLLGPVSVPDLELDRSSADSEPPPSQAAPTRREPEVGSALSLLALLQREGRRVDFLEQQISDFDDADVGSAARVVHEGCRRALHASSSVEPVRDEEEESPIEIPGGYDVSAVKLTGEVSGKPPFRGVLKHRGWRVRGLSLPSAMEGHDATIVAAAEVEL
jgi:hypothetical protein